MEETKNPNDQKVADRHSANGLTQDPKLNGASSFLVTILPHYLLSSLQESQPFPPYIHIYISLTIGSQNP